MNEETIKTCHMPMILYYDPYEQVGRLELIKER